MDLSQIKDPKFLKGLSTSELKSLSDDIRKFLIESISKTGGHLSSNLGVVELTVALHYVFDVPKDKVFFDVGHQSYTHKILTGRADRFSTLRQYNGLSGFQKRAESIYDVWEAGHSSTALSAALGMAISRDLNKDNYSVVPVVGDGSMSSGMSLEALNQIGAEKRNMTIIFNDNAMSISQNVGALTNAFSKLRTSKSYTSMKSDLKNALEKNEAGQVVLKSLKAVKNVIKNEVVDDGIFGEFGIEYLGPVDGHNIKALIKILKVAKEHDGPVVVHVITKKGKGYSFCENDGEGKWHGVSSFNVETGQTHHPIPEGHLNWSQVISDTVLKLAKNDDNICAITPAMITGSKLEKFFALYPDRAFDCGIAEEHATTLAASLALSGKRPFLAIYSSFLQRAYDQVNHDICRMDVPVVIGIDRAGLVGDDGDTHHGLFDIAILKTCPNLIISQPKDSNEAQRLVYTAFNQLHPFAIRFPRGTIEYDELKNLEPIKIGSWETLNHKNDNKCIVITYGPDVDRVLSKVKSNDLPVTVINARFFKPIDESLILAISEFDVPVIVYETDLLEGGLGASILEYTCDNNIKLNMKRIGIKDEYVQHGANNQLRKALNIDIESLFKEIDNVLDK